MKLYMFSIARLLGPEADAALLLGGEAAGECGIIFSCNSRNSVFMRTVPPNFMI